MNPSVSDRIGRIINPPVPTAAGPAAPSIEPLQSLPVLIGWMLGPPAPMPRSRAIVEGELQIVGPDTPGTELPTGLTNA